MASIWKGAIAFGLVHIPVELRPAVRADHISFRLLHADDLSPVRYERICAADGEPVPWSEIVKGFEYEKGKFIVMTDDDFAAAALGGSRTIEILDFVRQDEIDPRYFETPYFLAPTRGGERGYALLREAVRRSGTVGIGKIVLREKEHLAGIKVIGDVLVLEIMRFAAELVDAASLDLPSGDTVRPQELRMAEQLVESLTTPFDPSRYGDDYRERLMRVIRAKMKGKKVAIPEEAGAPRDTQVIDLMSRLRESLDRPRAARARRAGAVRSGRRTAAAKERAKPAGRRAPKRSA
ncbi:MAG TPA: Ku protein [Gemmatimonadaceae bacterium]